jgi:S-(hydroxymethyl)glutathione dehydrogenase/alcohol dehydrogenase
VKIRKDMSLELAALIGCGVITGYGAVVNTARVQAGETVAVIGCGGVGMAAINGAEIRGRRPHHRDRHQSRETAARDKLGVTDIIDPRNGDVVQQVSELTGGGVPHAFEVLGRKETAEQAFGRAGNRSRAARSSGRTRSCDSWIENDTNRFGMASGPRANH